MGKDVRILFIIFFVHDGYYLLYLETLKVKNSILIPHLTFKRIHLPQVQFLFSVVVRLEMNLSGVVINLTSKMSPLAGSGKSARY